MRKIILAGFIIAALFCTSLIDCSSKTEISEEEIKQFVIEYDDALSKGWSESDEIFVPWVTEKYLWKNALLDHYSNEHWFIYKDDIEILSFDKIPKDEYEFFGKNSYNVWCRCVEIAKIENGKIIPIPESDKYVDYSVTVAPINGELMVTGYAYKGCWVKEKDLPALIKRKGLTWAE